MYSGFPYFLYIFMPTRSQKQSISVNKPLSQLFEDQWNAHDEGELAVDVYEDDSFLYIQAAVAGVTPEHIEIALRGTMVTVRGFRVAPIINSSSRYHCQECFWGPFSRSIIMPELFNDQKVEAILENGILTIRLPKK